MNRRNTSVALKSASPRPRLAPLLTTAFGLWCGTMCHGRDPALSGLTHATPVAVAVSRPPAPGYTDGVLENRFAYIPEECYAKTQRDGGQAKNPCYVCHVRSAPPNYVDDADLQLSWKLPPGAAKNPWHNLFSPAVSRVPRPSDDEILTYVRQSNYFDAQGNIALAERLHALPPEWDGDGDAHWDGFVPDAWFRFDARGFDHTPAGVATGWRAFAYTPLPAFFPTNGSADDVLIRLDPLLRQDARGKLDPRTYAVNLAVVEALITRRDVPIDPVDENELGVDLDLDGKLGRADHVAYDGSPDGATRLRYAGAAALQTQGTFPIAPGLFPLGTELLHSVRYLDVTSDGSIRMAARMKELRYAKKVRWLGYDDIKTRVDSETAEQSESPDGSHAVLWEHDQGVYNGQGWLLQAFIEARDGALRPETYQESAACVGCHGGIGATTDSMFSFARKLGQNAPARGWFHWSAHGLSGLPEPRSRNGGYEYAAYLEHAGAADDFGDNTEASARFLDAAGRLRANAVERLHQDIGTLLLPSRVRALDLDRAYQAVVLEQGFGSGRGARLEPTEHAFTEVPLGAATGVRATLGEPNKER